MSTHLFTVMEQSKQSGTPLAVLLAIAAHADMHTGIAYPGNARLAELCNTTERTIQRTIQKLADDGDITILEDGNGRGNKRVMLVNAIRKGDTHDTLSYRKDDTSVTVYEDKKGDTEGVKGDTHDTKGDTEGVKGDTAMSPEQYNNKNSIEQPPTPQAAGGDDSDKSSLHWSLDRCLSTQLYEDYFVRAATVKDKPRLEKFHETATEAQVRDAWRAAREAMMSGTRIHDPIAYAFATLQRIIEDENTTATPASTSQRNATNNHRPSARNSAVAERQRGLGETVEPGSDEWHELRAELGFA